MLFAVCLASGHRKKINEHNTFKRLEKDILDVKILNCQQFQNLVPLAPASPNHTPLLPSSILVLEAGRSQTNDSCWTPTSAKNPRTICSFQGKNALQFLSLHLVFAKRPHADHHLKWYCGIQKGISWPWWLMVLHQRPEPSLKKQGEAQWLC